MEDRGEGAGQRLDAGAANTPPFGDSPAVRTAADHQISDRSEAGRTGGIEQAAEEARSKMDEAADEAEDRANQGMRQAADRLDDTARRADEFADERLRGGGMKGRAGQAVHSGARAAEQGAEYLRSHDMTDLRDQLENQVRERPVQTLLAAVAVGWLAGKILR